MEASMVTLIISVGILVIAALITVLTGRAVVQAADAEDFETRKIRFAAVTFSGIVVLILASAVLAFNAPTMESPGVKVFETILTALTPIAGGIIGYLFAAKDKTNTP